MAWLIFSITIILLYNLIIINKYSKNLRLSKLVLFLSLLIVGFLGLIYGTNFSCGDYENDTKMTTFFSKNT